MSRNVTKTTIYAFSRFIVFFWSYNRPEGKMIWFSRLTAKCAAKKNRVTLRPPVLPAGLFGSTFLINIPEIFWDLLEPPLCRSTWKREIDHRLLNVPLNGVQSTEQPWLVDSHRLSVVKFNQGLLCASVTLVSDFVNSGNRVIGEHRGIWGRSPRDFRSDILPVPISPGRLFSLLYRRIVNKR